ncbi:MAG: hypothetical protein ACRDRJ_38845, partial [Streptosporangiaceae bacterium]
MLESAALVAFAASTDLARAPYTVLGWPVPDITAMTRALAAKGVAFHSCPSPSPPGWPARWRDRAVSAETSH